MIGVGMGVWGAALRGRARVNVLTSPTNFGSASWSANGVTKAAGAITETATTGVHLLQQGGISFTSGQVYTLEVEAAPNGANCIQLVHPSGAFGAAAFANYDVATGGLGLTGAAAISPVAPVALDGGYYLCRLTSTATATATVAAGVMAFCSGDDAATAARLASYLGNTSRSLLIRAARLYLGA